MKVLHVSNCANISGWSKQAEMHLLALDSAGVDVSARNINILNNVNNDLHPRVQELLRKDCVNPDVIILNTLPSYYERTARSKTVGYYVIETSNFRDSGWSSKINLLDAGLVPCYHNKQASIESGVKIPLHVVPECVDTSRYGREYPTHNIRQVHKDKFLFLVVAEFTRRKNIEAIVKAFHSEFSPAEGVELVIKTTPVGMSNPQADINARLENVKRGLKFYNNLDRYKKENVICGFLSETDMCSLYQSVDCVVNASRGEAFCIPVVEGMGFGKTIISPDHSGLDYVNDKNSYVVKSFAQPCFEAMDTLPDLYSSNELWSEVCIQSLRECMRSAYEKRSLNLRKQQQARKDVMEFSIENVGKAYRNTLEKIL